MLKAWEGVNGEAILKCKPGDRPHTESTTVAEGLIGMRNTFLLLIILFSCNCFSFEKKNTIIPPVVVKAKKFNNLSLSHAPKTVITQKDFASQGVTNTEQALQQLGSVQLQDILGNGSQVGLSMRGFGSNASSNTLLLINGIPITNPDMMPPDLNAIPINEIEYIEVVEGTESVLYGDQAVGGTINIVTRKNSKDIFEVACVNGSYNQHNCYATLNNHVKNLKYGIGASTANSDNYRDRSAYGQNSTNGHFDYAYSSGNASFIYRIANERMQYPGALTVEQVAQNRRQASSNINFFRNWNGIYQFQDQQQLNSNWQIDTDFTRREMHGDGVLSSSFTQTRTIHYFKSQLKGKINETKIASGIDLQNDHYHLTSLFGANDDSQQKYGLFGIVNTPLNDKLSVSAGARGAQQNNVLEQTLTTNSVNRAVATTLGMNYQLSDNAKIYLRRAENFRFPKADEDASTPPGVNGLKTQRGVSYETGTEWCWRMFKTKFGIYQLNLRDEIQFDPTQTPETPFGVNRNLDPTVRRGAFLTEKLQATDKISIDGQYNYVNARFQNGPYEGKRIPLVSENIIHAGINYKFAPYWNLYTEAVMNGSQFADNDNANIAKPVAGYTLFNMNLRYHFKFFTASFRVNNILDKNYYFYTVFQPNLQSEFFYPAPTRNFVLTIKYTIA